ncbi:LOB domain-containing protein 20 isoform X1 [Punica granatum]|uniref:LOB domain-containing protein 20 isoform X1 n=1 Tax=Punica granatum TaxID=22663 RepID=A0A218X0X6_PUNGR|nr:LOB domain-containing protein 20 isoform X1 [Punica granatum]OWM78835.1 hypothetical protein CDL15_Pgr003006 [Punica granatum]
MADPQDGNASSPFESSQRSAHKQAVSMEAKVSAAAPLPVAPCGACKFLRRKCVSGCIFAPHFGSDQGAARFAAVHKIFGASNVSKLLLHIPVNRRHDAVVTISYEAQARLADPVYGSVSTILALQQQVASLQAELTMVQSQLINSRYAVANALHSHGPDAQLLPSHHQSMSVPVCQQPAYSNNSSASNLIDGSFSHFATDDFVAPESNDSNYINNSRSKNNNAASSGPPETFPRRSQDEEDGEEEYRNGLSISMHTDKMLLSRT